MKKTLVVTTFLCAMLASQAVFAFCGFYVGGGGKDLFNDATMVVMMRDGTRTVLSMQNDYSGPPEDFALVIPVPQVLKEENVKTLDKNIFTRVDQLASPRLVEYWERDPCYKPRRYKSKKSMAPRAMADMPSEAATDDFREKVKVEAKFTVGEYDIVVLSASEATALDKWLRAEKYNIPKNAEKYFRPYIEAGQYFFVAKVNSKKVSFAGGRATLSPLRFHYDSEQFTLPIRLGLINSRGQQDLIVHILATDRYEAANYPNTRIPTNLEVKAKTKKNFGPFYASLFAQVQAKKKNVVVTEYAWAPTNCDPCPTGSVGGGALNWNDLNTLGADVIAGSDSARMGKSNLGWVLTRLHTRYGAKGVGEDLIFKKADPIVGGRVGDGRYAKKHTFNQFQARYIIRHRWKGPIKCRNPKRGVWGGPWASVRKKGVTGAVKAAPKTAYVKKRNLKISPYIKGTFPRLSPTPIEKKKKK